MAAGGWKIFTAGDVLTADDTMDYLQQGVLVFASSGARGSAIAAPAEGQFSYLKDTDATEYYDGAAWTPVAQGGLVHIVTESFSAVSSVSLDNCFSGDYDNYRMLMNITSASASSTYNIRMRASAADNTTNNYQRQVLYAQSVTSAGAKNTSTSAWVAGQYNSANTYHGFSSDVFGPAKAQVTTIVGVNGELDAADYLAKTFVYIHSATTQFDGFTVYADSGTFTGTVSVYGYKS